MPWVYIAGELRTDPNLPHKNTMGGIFSNKPREVQSMTSPVRNGGIEKAVHRQQARTSRASEAVAPRPAVLT